MNNEMISARSPGSDKTTSTALQQSDTALRPYYIALAIDVVLLNLCFIVESILLIPDTLSRMLGTLAVMANSLGLNRSGAEMKSNHMHHERFSEERRDPIC
jgi:hypothetical protein